MKNNEFGLLFALESGNIIAPSTMNKVFKRICRENSIEKTDENRIFNTNKTI